VRIETDGGPLHVINTHLGLSAAERRLQAEALLGEQWLGRPGCDEPRILCGDLNALPWSRAYRRLTEHLVDVQAALSGHRPARTFFGRLPAMRIDHILVDPAITPIDVEVATSQLARVASDHLPLVAELRLPPRRARRAAA
jgi:endonuclease/exonuclease/phosphatase family metal-dependent hydrolase